MSIDDRFEEDLRRRFADALDGVEATPALYHRTESRMKRHTTARLLAAVAVAGLVVTAGVVAIITSDTPREQIQVDPVAPPDDDPTEAPTGDAIEEPGEAPIEDPTEQPGEQPSEQPSETASPIVQGDPYEGPPIVAGAALAVIGVEADDVLNVRAAPGTDQDIVATLDPHAEGFTATGEGRTLPGTIWVEIDTGDVTGWVSSVYIAHTGATNDITSQIVDAHGSTPSAETLSELAQIVAGHRATEDPASTIVISSGPELGDLGEVTVDVVGFGDDSVRAERLVIFATADEGGESFTIRSVEATTFCGRGVTDDDLCI